MRPTRPRRTPSPPRPNGACLAHGRSTASAKPSSDNGAFTYARRGKGLVLKRDFGPGNRGDTNEIVSALLTADGSIELAIYFKQFTPPQMRTQRFLKEGGGYRPHFNRDQHDNYSVRDFQIRPAPAHRPKSSTGAGTEFRSRRRQPITDTEHPCAHTLLLPQRTAIAACHIAGSSTASKRMTRMGRLEGKVAVITGAARGIGATAARLFAKEGARLMLADMREEPLQELVREIGGNAAAQVTDVTDEAAVRKLFEATVAKFGRLDIALLNAGIAGRPSTIRDYPAELFDQVIAVNVRGVWLGLKYAMKAMEPTGGSIVITSSTAGIRATPNMSPYTASKHAAIGLMRAAAIEGAHAKEHPRQHRQSGDDRHADGARAGRDGEDASRPQHRPGARFPWAARARRTKWRT